MPLTTKIKKTFFPPRKILFKSIKSISLIKKRKKKHKKKRILEIKINGSDNINEEFFFPRKKTQFATKKKNEKSFHISPIIISVVK